MENLQTIKQILLNEIKERKQMAFDEIIKLFKKNDFDYKGRKALIAGEDPKGTLVIWWGFNQNTFDLLTEKEA